MKINIKTISFLARIMNEFLSVFEDIAEIRILKLFLANL